MNWLETDMRKGANLVGRQIWHFQFIYRARIVYIRFLKNSDFEYDFGVVGEMFEGDFEDMCSDKFSLMSIRDVKHTQTWSEDHHQHEMKFYLLLFWLENYQSVFIVRK